MACFVVPAVEAVVTTAVTRVVKNREAKNGPSEGISLSKKLSWLNNMLWGGSGLLAFEHVWHGEVTPWFPFLTNAASPETAAQMLFEMVTSGVAMAVVVTVAWAGIVTVADGIARNAAPTVPVKQKI